MTDDRMIMMLLCIRDRKVMQQMCRAIGRSMGIVQRHCRYLERHGYIESAAGPGGHKTKNAGRRLTDTGRRLLESYNHKSNPQ